MSNLRSSLTPYPAVLLTLVASVVSVSCEADPKCGEDNDPCAEADDESNGKPRSDAGPGPATGPTSSSGTGGSRSGDEDSGVPMNTAGTQGEGGTSSEGGAGGKGGAAGEGGNTSPGALPVSDSADCLHADGDVGMSACKGSGLSMHWECPKSPSDQPPAAGCAHPPNSDPTSTGWCCSDPFCSPFSGDSGLCGLSYPDKPKAYICARDTPGTKACAQPNPIASPQLFCCK